MSQAPDLAESLVSEHVALLFLDEGRREPVDLLVTPKLASALVRAAESGIDTAKDLSFTSLFVGLWATQGHPVTHWMVETLSGKPFQNLLSKAGLTEPEFERLRALPDDSLGRFRTQPFTRTVSARSALDEAARLARDLDDVPDLHHVVAAFLSLPHYHDADFRNFHVDRPALAANFGSRMAHAYRDQAAFWDGFAARVFPQTHPSPSASDSPTRVAATSNDAVRALDLRAGQAEPAVITALNLAAAVAGKEPVGPRAALLAVLALADRGQSVAFRRLARIVPIAPDEAAKQHARTVSSNPSQEPPQLTQELLALLAGAQEAQRGSGTARGLWGRDLVTALLLVDDAELRALLEQHRCPLDDVRDQWFGFVTSDQTGKIPRSYWEDFWGRAGVPLPAPYRSGYATETDQGEDKLGIEGEARAFARLILDRKVTPPLSIGLLGDWGSGKSFFIEQIKKEIAALKQDSHAELYSNVIEIEFNAWHVSDSNLWASLVTHIFDQIWDNVSAPEASEKTNEDAKDELTAAIEEARGAVHRAEGQVTVARAGLAAAEEELERRKRALAWKNHVDSVTDAALKEIAQRAGWRKPLETINDVGAAFEALSTASRRFELILASLLERPLLHIAVPVAIAVAGTFGLWRWVEGLHWQDAFVAQVSKWLTAAAGVAGAVVLPLRQAVTKVNELSGALESVEKEYDASLAALERENPKEALRLKNARRELESAEASVQVAKDKLSELLNQRATLNPGQRLGAFLEERVRSTQYRSQQGIISLVHKDFRVLSQLMKALRESPPGDHDGAPDPERHRQLEEARKAIKPFDRIVLYVDDLDRCRPEHVVAMLEAVHLLLALDLFVAVVAVDARWLTRSLEVHYKDLLRTDEGEDDRGLRVSTPQGYLEKIFQITYALGPMDPAYFSNYVRFLAGSEEESTPARTADRNGAANGSAASRKAPGASSTTGGGATGSAAPAAAPRGGETADARTRASDRRPADTSTGANASTGNASASTQGMRDENLVPARKRAPAIVTITGDEQELIAALVPLLPTPRVAKRLVNVYRLIKSSMGVEAAARFRNEQREGSCLLMLAILFGRPAVAGPLLRALHERQAPFDRPERSLLEAIELQAALPHRDVVEARADWLELLATLRTMKVVETCEQCAREPLDIARYSLAAGRDWHTWRRAPGARASAPAASGGHTTLKR